MAGFVDAESKVDLPNDTKLQLGEIGPGGSLALCRSDGPSIMVQRRVASPHSLTSRNCETLSSMDHHTRGGRHLSVSLKWLDLAACAGEKMKFLRQVLAEIRTALITFLFFLFLRMLLNELSAFQRRQRGSAFKRGLAKSLNERPQARTPDAGKVRAEVCTAEVVGTIRAITVTMRASKRQKEPSIALIYVS